VKFQVCFLLGLLLQVRLSCACSAQASIASAHPYSTLIINGLHVLVNYSPSRRSVALNHVYYVQCLLWAILAFEIFYVYMSSNQHTAALDTGAGLNEEQEGHAAYSGDLKR
jgi:hypothetical protein